MATPSNAINRFDLSLSYGEFDTRANRRKYIGAKVLPPAVVGHQSANFLRLAIASVLNKVEDTVRAPKGEYTRGDFEWDQDSYVTLDHGVEEEIDDRQLAMYRGEINADRIHTQRAIDRVLTAYENEVATAVFNTSTWTGSALTTSVGTPWTTESSADPIGDIDAAGEKVRAGIGMMPNTLIATDFAIKRIKRCDQIVDRLKYSGHDDPKNVSLAALADLLEVETILVARSHKNTNDDGQTASLSRMWDQTMAMVCYIGMEESLEAMEPTIGRTIQWDEENASLPGEEEGTPAVIMEEYRTEATRGYRLRARLDYGIKILHPECGHLLTSVTA